MTTTAASVDGEEFGREIRIGLVMYGGVSLAIYINGVAREFFEAVRGRGVYALLKHLLDSDIVVDIISGASAGGINGVFLAYALANDRDFSKLADLWRDQADIDDLLRPVWTAKPESLFASETYYQTKLEGAFKSVHDKKDAPGTVPSRIEAIDLFVVGTDYHGVRTFRPDALGNMLAVKTYRTVFRLKHRIDRDSDSDLSMKERGSPEAALAHRQALASACRITSAFPAALAPVRVPHRAAAAATAKTDWAAMVNRWGVIGRESYYIDGGVLDNKPFTDLVEQIYFRTAVRPVDRKIFYVEPDPEEFAQIDEVARPSFTGVITSSLLAIPRYESIAFDLEAIEIRNQRLDQYRQIAKKVMEGPAPRPTPHESITYRISRARQFLAPFREWIGATDQRVASDPLQLARVQAGRALADDAVELLANKGCTLLDRHDVERTLRRLFFVSYQLRDALFLEARPDEQVRAGKNLRFGLTRHIQIVKLMVSILEEFHRTHADGCVTEAKGSAGALVQALEWRLDALFDAAGCTALLSQPFPDVAEDWAGYIRNSAIEELKKMLAGDSGRCKALVKSRSARPVPTVVRAVEKRTEDLLAHFAGGGTACEIAARFWTDFPGLDDQLFPLENLGRLREKDRIETVRVSPRDAQLGFSSRSARDKVAGDALGHFGGFLKKSWRTNDILWGRLDARCLIIQALLDDGALKKIVDRPAQRERIRKALGGGEAVARLLPDAGTTDLQSITDWLDRLLSDVEKTRDSALAQIAPASPDAIIPILVGAAQSSILVEDLPTAARDAGGAQPSSSTAADLASFFTKDYHVGEENPLEHIESRDLLKTASHVGLVARNALFASMFGEVPVRSRILAPVKHVVGAPLWLAYWFATVVRSRSARIAVAVACALLLLIAMWWPVVLSGPGEPPDAGATLRWVTIFVLIPAGWLLMELIVFLMRTHRWVWGALVVAILLLTGLAIARGPFDLRSPITWSPEGW
jgi:patatin-related protein